MERMIAMIGMLAVCMSLPVVTATCGDIPLVVSVSFRVPEEASQL